MLKSYKFKGGDKGYMFKYFYNPVSDKLVKVIPRGFAPNILTLIGFFFSLLPFMILFASFGTHFHKEKDREIARWFYIF